jgi:hypothetical protein
MSGLSHAHAFVEPCKNGVLWVLACVGACIH